ncbi:hypothetical protein [Pseudomonas quasicaspiana]|uniref:hypothetical protein n=1 Tax=Pseudomonas quasicaspiana TaxID=2829821 RepID=UPI001E5F39B7|nr:hypothetical protein [Pseudomonas quasicaspiana]MCD5970646.1 hypothetical protein [Pseudomonas quasicaspiana]
MSNIDTTFTSQADSGLPLKAVADTFESSLQETPDIDSGHLAGMGSLVRDIEFEIDELF